MIRYRLVCSQDHEFEAWFKDSASYDTQVAEGHVTCPECGDDQVTKAVMAPGLKSSRSADAYAEAKAHEVAERILAAVGAVHDEVEDEFDYVGDQFADEARAIHYGEAEERGIYGEATLEEAADLQDGGIDFFRLPDQSNKRKN